MAYDYSLEGLTFHKFTYDSRWEGFKFMKKRINFT